LLLTETVHTQKDFCASLEDVPALLAGIAQAGDVVLCLGAGPIGALPGDVITALHASGSRGEASPSAPEGAAELRVIAGGR
jgi:UDP-N-acetylmuramate--alanine ligase